MKDIDHFPDKHFIIDQRTALSIISMDGYPNFPHYIY